MTMPDGSDSAQGAQILLKLGELGADMAVVKERLKDVPNLTDRLRAVELAQAENKGSRDVQARLWAAVAVLAAAGSAIVQYLHK